MLAAITSPSVPWLMGPIEKGWKWFAFTFQDQKKIGLNPGETGNYVKRADYSERERCLVEVCLRGVFR
jgi:hypothetical protein